MEYRREIDGLRALAVLPVMFFHAGFDAFRGGYVGVDVFFVISGFLITTILVAELQAGRFSLQGFYERRARRILPALFVVMLACLPFAWLWLTPNDLKDFAQSLIAVPMFVSNILFWRESGYFDAAAELKPLLHTWSLAVEEQFYLLFPLFLLMAWRLGRNWIIVILCVIGVLSLAAAQWASVHAPAANFYLLPTRAWELAAGALVAFAIQHGKLASMGGVWRHLGSLAGLALVLYAVAFFDRTTPFPSLYTVVPVLGTCLLILFATPATLVGRLMGSQALVAVGLVSYSAYLWHQPVLAFARHRLMGEPSHAWLLALLSLSLGLAFLTWRFVEVPFRDRRRLTRGQVFLAGGLISTVFVALGLVGHKADGFPGRRSYSAEQLLIIESQKMDSTLRFRAIEPDVCHFSNQSGIGVERFIAQWRCSDKALVPGSIPAPFIIAGDSNAADLATALRMNGLLPLHMTGSGCALVPSQMTVECRRLFARLREEVADNPDYRYLLLTNLYTAEELDIRSVRKMHAYWKGFGKKIILFTGTPRFPRHQDYVLAGAVPRIDLQREELALTDEVQRFLADNDVAVVDRNVIFCSINDCSYYSPDGAVLIADARGEHLTMEGARLFGRALLESDTEIGRWSRSRTHR